jgi:hypothetical protein
MTAVAEKKFLISRICAPIPLGNRRFLIKIPILALSLVSLTGGLTARAQILNGSFESPVISNLNVVGLGVAPGITVYTSLGNPNGITGWTITSGDVSLVNGSAALTSTLGLFTANTGNQYAVLNGIAETVTVAPLGVNIAQTGNVGVLSQTFSTVAGKMYQISFAYRRLSVGALTDSPVVDVGLTNASNSTAPANGTLTANVSLNAWEGDTFNFTATGTSSTLSFSQDATGANIGLVGLDSVTLTALPEPSQYGAAAMAFLALVVSGRILAEWRGRPAAVVA